MGERRSDALRGDIERLRGEVSTSVHRLTDTLAVRADWRGAVKRRPWTYVSGALVLGLVLGLR